MYPYSYGNQNMLNQLMRQKENVESMINQYSQLQNQPPIQNIINQGTSIDFEARILTNGEDISNIGITKRTLFVDEKNEKVVIKELDGTISKEYKIVVPLDEKDQKILELENKIKEMEVKINESAKRVRTDDECFQSNANVDGNVDTTTKSSSKNVSKSTKG